MADEKPAGQAVAPAPDTTLEDLKSGKVQMRDLDPKVRATAMEKIRHELTGADESPASPEPESKPAEVPVEKPAEKVEEKPAKAMKPVDLDAMRKDNQRIVDEANKLEQQNEAKRKRLEKAKTDREALDKLEVKPPEDAWDPAHQVKLNETVERLQKRTEFLEKTLEERDREEVEALVKTTQEARENETFGSIHTLQEEYPDQLKTSKPFKELNDANTQWVSDLIEKSGVKEKMPGATPEQIFEAASNRYQSDPEFQKSVRPNPISEADFPKYKVICDINARKQKVGGTYKGHILEWFDSQGILADAMQKGRKEAAEDAAMRTVKAIQKTEEQPKPISPSDGSAKNGYLEPEMTLQKAADIQTQLVKKQKKGQLSPEERALLPKVNAIIRAAYAGAQ